MSSSNNPTPPDSPAAKRPKTAVTDEIRFRRFLILGAEDGTFSQTEHELAVENAQALARLIAAGQGTQCVAELVRVSTAGLAPKPTTTIFALAMLVRLGDPATKKAAYTAVNGVLRTPTTSSCSSSSARSSRPVARAGAGPTAGRWPGGTRPRPPATSPAS